MHPLLRNHRSWILTALFIAVTHVHRGECDDGLFKSILQSGKTGFLKTYEKTYHTKYEFDLNDALHQTGRMLRKMASPVVTVETDPTKNEELLQDTAFDLQEYCDSDEDELIRDLHSKPEALHEESAEEDHRSAEDRLHAKQGFFNIGKLFFKPKIFKKKQQKTVRDRDTSHRDGHQSEDHLKTQDPDSFHKDGHHGEDHLKTQDQYTFHNNGPHGEDHLQIHDPDTLQDHLQIDDPDNFHSDGHHNEDHLNTTEHVSSAEEHHTGEEKDRTTEHEDQAPAKAMAFNFGKLFFRPELFQKMLQRKTYDPDTFHRDRPHSDDHPKVHDPDTFHSDEHDSGDHLNTSENVSSARQDPPVTTEESINIGQVLPSPEINNTDTGSIHDQHAEALLPTTDETEAHSEHPTGGHLNATEVSESHPAKEIRSSGLKCSKVLS